MHTAVQVPFTQTGVEPEQLASPVHCVPVVGVQTPLEQVAPFAHGAPVALHPATHCPSAQISFALQSLVYVHAFAGAVQAFATHTSPPVQSALAEHGQGPFVPPHAWHLFATHAEPLVQSAVVLHPLTLHVPETQTPPVVQSAVVVQVQGGFEPPPPHATHAFVTHVWPGLQSVGTVHCTCPPSGVVPGAMQRPDVQTVPRGQSSVDAHIAVHPRVVHSWPVGHPLSLVHACDVGGATVLQP